eukprot:403360313
MSLSSQPFYSAESNNQHQTSSLFSFAQTDSQDNSCDQICRKALYYCVGNLHFYLFLIGFIVRYSRHKNIGKYNLRAPRPFTYIIKIILQSIMTGVTFAMIYDVNYQSQKFESIAILYVFYGCMWLLSIYLQYFEYKRGLPHAWYTHQAFWILSLVSNIALFTFLIYYENLFNFKEGERKMNFSLQIKCIICFLVGIISSLFLSVMGIKYKREYPQSRRNYLPRGDEKVQKIVNTQLFGYGNYNEKLLGNDPLSTMQFTGGPSDLKQTFNNQTSLTRMPVIKATVQSYAIEQATVNFKILVTKENFAQKKIKKTYNDFLELDQILESKYVKYIRRGIMSKCELPKRDQFNFNNIQSLEQYKNQLKQYLDSLSNEPNTQINEENKDDLTVGTNTNVEGQNQNALGFNYIPREILMFYNIDLRLVDPIMNFQENLLNQHTLSADMTESNIYGKDQEIIIKRTDSIKNDVKNFLLNVLKREELYKIKIDCIQKNVTSSFDETNIQAQTETEGVIFTFQINNCFVFNKTLREVEKFCKDVAALIQNPLILPMGDLFLFCYALEDSTNLNNTSRITSQVNIEYPRLSGNMQQNQNQLPQNTSHDTSRRYRILYQELEQACIQLEGYFKLLLNDPDFYTELLYQFFNQHQIFELFPFVALFRTQNKHLISQQKTLTDFKQLNISDNSILQNLQQSQDQMMQQSIDNQSNFNQNQVEYMMDDIIEEDEEESKSNISPFLFSTSKQNSGRPSMHNKSQNHQQRFAKDLRLTGRNISIMGFLGLNLSCKVIKHQIQIFGGHPTNIFTVQVTKRYPTQESKNNVSSDRDSFVEEQWNIKIAISFVIQLANDLNIKYSTQGSNIQQLLLSLLEYQNQVNHSYQNTQKLRELEHFLNQLLQKDTLIFSPALRALFQFDYIHRKNQNLKSSKNKEEDPFGDKSSNLRNLQNSPYTKNELISRNFTNLFNQNQLVESHRSSSELNKHGHIIESDGQVEDYFNNAMENGANSGSNNDIFRNDHLLIDDDEDMLLLNQVNITRDHTAKAGVTAPTSQNMNNVQANKFSTIGAELQKKEKNDSFLVSGMLANNQQQEIVPSNKNHIFPIDLEGDSDDDNEQDLGNFGKDSDEDIQNGKPRGLSNRNDSAINLGADIKVSKEYFRDFSPPQ